MSQSYQRRNGIGKKIIKMNWVSPEVEQYYNIFNKIYTNIIMFHHPYVKLLRIDAESFNNVFINEKLTDVMVICCADFADDKYSNEKEKRSLGDDISHFFIDFQKMIPNSEILKKRIYPTLEINKTKYCENFVKYHYK